MPESMQNSEDICNTVGAATVEMAVTVLVFLGLLIGTFQFLWAGYNYVALNLVAQKAARWGTLGYTMPDPLLPAPAMLSREDSVIEKARELSLYYSLDLSNATFTICLHAPTALSPLNCRAGLMGGHGDLFTFVINKRLQLFSEYIPQGFNLSARAVGRNE